MKPTNTLLIFLALLISGCATVDNREFNATQDEIDLASVIGVLRRRQPVNKKDCRVIGDLKINSAQLGQPATIVAARKYYKHVSLIKYTFSEDDKDSNRIDNYDVYSCRR